MGCGPSAPKRNKETTAIVPGSQQVKTPNVLTVRERRNLSAMSHELPADTLAALQDCPFLWTSPEIYTLYPKQVWDHYAGPGMETLGREALHLLARDCVMRFMHVFRELLRKEKKLKDRELDSKVNQRRPFYLPGVDLDDSIQCVEYYLAAEMKMHKGVVTKSSFFLHFPVAHKKLLAIETLKISLEQERLVTELNQAAIRRATKTLNSKAMAGLSSVRAAGGGARRPATSGGTGTVRRRAAQNSADHSGTSSSVRTGTSLFAEALQEEPLVEETEDDAEQKTVASRSRSQGRSTEGGGAIPLAELQRMQASSSSRPATASSLNTRRLNKSLELPPLEPSKKKAHQRVQSVAPVMSSASASTAPVINTKRPAPTLSP